MVRRELEAAAVLSVGILIAVIVLAFMLDRSALAATGSSFISAVVGFFRHPLLCHFLFRK